jgi:hypothetical protein
MKAGVVRQFTISDKEPGMSKYVEFPLEGGGSILIEAADDKKTTGGGFVKAGNEGEKPAEPAKASFDQAVEGVRASSNLLVSKLRSLSQPPDEMEVTFSLKASGEVGNLFVAKGPAEASYNVTLRWHKEEKKDEKKE